MAIEITVPRLGWSMEEGAFAGWLKQNGDLVSAGEPLFALESDKVTMDVESLDSGMLHIPANAPETGASVRVGQMLGYLLAPGESPPAAGAIVQRVGDSVAEQPSAMPQQHAASQPPSGHRNAVTPRARRVAAELEVDTASIRGSGRNGRIREADVRAASTAAVRSIPIAPLRRTIAARMMESRQNTAPVTLTTRADATALVALRIRLSPAPSYTVILAKLVAIALPGHATLNARWEGDRIALASKTNIGIAVDTPQGLLVPVLHDVAATALSELQRRLRELMEAALARRLRREDLTGGTFTITNLGAYGIDAFTPIIHFPETAVLGVGAIRKEAVVLASGGIAVREQLTLSLTFDHRVVDGAPAARFLQSLVQLIEAPPAM